MRLVLAPVAVALGTMLAAPAAFADSRGCEIQTGSYVRIVPRKAPKSDTIVAAPQTPCPVLDTGPQPDIGPISIDIKPPTRRRTPLPVAQPQAPPIEE